MAPWDRVVSPPTPLSYGPPLIGDKIGEMLASLPAAYVQGAQNAQQLRMMQPATGDITDPGNLLAQVNQRGGVGALSPYLQSLFDLKMLQQPVPIGSQGVAANGQPTATMQSQQPPTSTPGLSSAGTDNRGADSLSSLASEVFGDQDATAIPFRGGSINAIQRVAANMGLRPEQELTPAQAQVARTQFQRYATVLSGGQPPGQPPPTGQSAESADQPGPSTTQAQLAAGGGQDMAAPANTSGLSPQQQQQVAQLTRERDLLRGEAARVGTIPRFKGRADELAKAADDRQAQIQALQNLGLRNQELTGTQKEQQASGSATPLEYQRAAELAKAGGSENVKTWGKIVDEGASATGQLQLAQRMRQLGASSFTGGWANVVRQLGNVGINVDPRLPQVQGLEAAINQMIPSFKQPGMRVTNFDLSLFTDALPRMVNDPRGNAVILDTLEGMARYKVQRGDLAQRALNGEITPQQFRQQQAALPSPFAAFTNSPFAGKQQAPQGGAPQITSQQQYQALPSGTRFLAPDGKIRVKP